MPPDDLTVGRLIEWHRERAGLSMQAHHAATDRETRQQFFTLYERYSDTAALLTELLEWREELNWIGEEHG